MIRREFIKAVGAGAITAALPFKLDAAQKPLKVRVVPSEPIGFHVWKVGSNEKPATCADIEYATKVIEGRQLNRRLAWLAPGMESRPWLDGKPFNYMPIQHEFVEIGPDRGHLVVHVGDDDRPATNKDLAEVQEKLVKIFRSMPNDPHRFVMHHRIKLKWYPIKMDVKGGMQIPWESKEDRRNYVRPGSRGNCLVYYHHWDAEPGYPKWDCWQSFDNKYIDLSYMPGEVPAPFRSITKRGIC